MGQRDLPDIYAIAQRRGHIYLANPDCPCYLVPLRYIVCQTITKFSHLQLKLLYRLEVQLLNDTVHVQIFEGCNFCGRSKSKIFTVLFS